MQVLLRTASTLARACSEAAQRIEVRPVARLSINAPRTVAQRLDDIATTAETSIADALALINTRSAIRQQIGQANNETVDRVLTERDALNQSEKLLTALLDEIAEAPKSSARRSRLYGETAMARTEHDVAEVSAALETIRQRLTTVTTGEVSEFVEVAILPKPKIKQLQDQLAAIRRRRSALNDELAAANLNVKITLSDEVVTVLKKHQIIE